MLWLLKYFNYMLSLTYSNIVSFFKIIFFMSFCVPQSLEEHWAYRKKLTNICASNSIKNISNPTMYRPKSH